MCGGNAEWGGRGGLGQLEVSADERWWCLELPVRVLHGPSLENWTCNLAHISITELEGRGRRIMQHLLSLPKDVVFTCFFVC